MKKLIAILFCGIFTTAAFATIRTVSNLDSSAQYTSIQVACDSSKNGDSIYVSKSPNAYEEFTINNKKLAIFGPGWSPFVSGIAFVRGCTLTGTGASGSELHGLTFINEVWIQTADINNVIFMRNKFTTRVLFYAAVTNYLFEGNWFTSYSYLYNVNSYNSLSNFTIRNNIFYNEGSYNAYNFSGNNIFFDHNLWYGPSAGTSQCFYNCSNLILSNNIFVRRNAGGTSFSIFNNNITYLTGNDAPWNINNNTDAGGNVAGQDPQMAAQASVNNGVNDPLLDFTIAAGPANGTGGGTDMGLLYEKGGSLNWTRSRAARFPYISKMNITNLTIFKNSKIYFNVEAKSN